MHGKILSPANGRLAALLCKEPVALPKQQSIYVESAETITEGEYAIGIDSPKGLRL